MEIAIGMLLILLAVLVATFYFTGRDRQRAIEALLEDDEKRQLTAGARHKLIGTIASYEVHARINDDYCSRPEAWWYWFKRSEGLE